MPVEGSPFKVVHEKMKNVKKRLMVWSKATFINFFQKVSTMEDVNKVKELQLELDPSEENRAALRKVEAELRKFQRYEEEYWKQKANMHWLVDGDRNTKFFHNHVTGKKKKLGT